MRVDVLLAGSVVGQNVTKFILTESIKKGPKIFGPFFILVFNAFLYF